MDIPGCLACDIIAGRTVVAGGIIYQTPYWVVDHCIGPFPLSTLVLKPRRHVIAFADLEPDEAAEYGPLLVRVNWAVRHVTRADQVYNCQWSHGAWQAGHIHTLVQPVWNTQRECFNKPGPHLQAAMLDQGREPAREEVERVAVIVRDALSR